MASEGPRATVRPGQILMDAKDVLTYEFGGPVSTPTAALLFIRLRRERYRLSLFRRFKAREENFGDVPRRINVG